LINSHSLGHRFSEGVHALHAHTELEAMRFTDWIAAVGISRNSAHELLRLLRIKTEVSPLVWVDRLSTTEMVRTVTK